MPPACCSRGGWVLRRSARGHAGGRAAWGVGGAGAERVALRFEAGQAFLAGSFPELEAELAGLQAGGGYQGPGRSPDRADAMVWALTALSRTRSGGPRGRRLGIHVAMGGE